MKYVYYISNSGSDTNGDGSKLNPFATLAKAQSLLQNSTAILLDRGSEFNGTLDLSNLTNVLIDSYGTGDKPILNALKSVSGWISEGSNLYSKIDTSLADQITQIHINGTKALCGRTAISTSTSGNATTMGDTSRTEADGYWDGCEIVVHIREWAYIIEPVTTYASKTFNFPAELENGEVGVVYDAAAGKEYFIQNHKNALSVANTWAYDRTNKKIYIYATSSPTDVKAPYGTDMIYFDNAKHITIQNIVINGANQCAIRGNHSGHVHIENVDMRYTGIYSVFFMNTKDLTIKSCTGYDSGNDFINATYCQKILIEGNEGLRCGADPGENRYLPVQSRAMTSGIMINFSRDAIIKNNTIGYTSYCGIQVGFTYRFIVDGNYCHHFNLNKFDGGGIYTASNTRSFPVTSTVVIYPITTGRIINNIITDGNVEENSSGIYCDNDSQDIEIGNNFVSSCYYGLHLHDNSLLHIHHNTLVADNGQSAAIYHSMTSNTSINSVIEDNTIVCKTTDCAAVYVSIATARAQTYKNNTYYYPLGKKGTGTDNSMFLIASTWYDLDEWIADNSRVNWDRTGELELTTSVRDSNNPINYWVESFVNPSEEEIEVESTDLVFDDYVHLNGDTPSYPVAIQPHGSLILVRKNTNTATAELTVVLTPTGDGTGVGALGIRSLSTITLTLDGNGRFYDDAAGTINEGTERTCATTSTYRTFYIKVPSGTSNLVISDVREIERIATWNSTTNKPSMEIDVSKLVNIGKSLTMTGNNTAYGDISKLVSMEACNVYGNNTISGNPKDLNLLNSWDVRGSNTVEFTSLSKWKKICTVRINYTTLSSELVNQLLADLWANKDEDKPLTSRIIELSGKTGSGAPTGQGLIDKASLQAYRTPFNNQAYSQWTVTTR